MAQSGYTPILIYSSSTGGNAPSAANLTNSSLGSELAINISDGKLFYKDNGGVVQVIAWKVVPTSAGGTGLTSYTAGDTLYYTSGTTFSKLAIGSSGYYMSSSGSAPQWSAPGALTKTDDTNVTLTLGGSPTTALLNATSLTLGWTGQLSVSRGGTGLSTLTANYIPYGNGTSAFQSSSNLQFNGTQLSLTGTFQINTGNIVQGTAAKGINYTANTPASGMTSQLLNWYEEGTWTPTITFATPGDLAVSYSATIRVGTYTRVGNRVMLNFNVQTTSFTFTTASGALQITGLPFTAKNTTGNLSVGSMLFGGITKTGFTQIVPRVQPNNALIDFTASASGSAVSPVNATDTPTGGTINLRGSIVYEV